MKISNERWDEWFSAPITDAVSAESELAGIVVSMTPAWGAASVQLHSSRLWVYRRFRRLWPCVQWRKEKNLSEILHVKPHRVTIELPDELYRKIISKPLRNDFIRWPWMRGVFGCAGNIYNPRRGYYCLMRLREKRVARSALQLLKGSDITCSWREKKNVYELMIRDLRQIVRFCYFMGLEEVAQSLEERYLLRSNRDLANKQANCDSANIRRSLESSRQHIAVIKFLQELDTDLIPEKYHLLVKARLQHPEATLSDLGDMLRPQISKSTVKYRLKKLQRIAEAAGYNSHKVNNL